MLKWDFFELSDGISVGISDEGQQYIELDIIGWNDDYDYSDLETIAHVRATETEDNIVVTVRAAFEGVMKNQKVKALVDKAIEELKEEVSVHFS